MTDEQPIKTAIENIGKDGEGLGFGIEATRSRTAARVDGAKYLGKGWTIGGGLQWIKDKGTALFFGGRWRPGGRP